MATYHTHYLALPTAGKGPAVLVLHAWWGLNDFVKGYCDRLSQEGFVALAPDLFSGRIARTVQEAEQLNPGMDEEKEMPPLVLAAFEALRTQPAVTGNGLGVVGFSFGAYWARWLAQERPQSILAVTLFYGDGWNVQASNAAYLGHFAETDPYVTDEAKRELEDALKALNRPVDFHTYPGTGHWFVETDRPDAFNAPAAQLAWDRTNAFLHQHLRVGKA
jgi:carboxymethylenebutenolidase